MKLLVPPICLLADLFEYFPVLRIEWALFFIKYGPILLFVLYPAVFFDTDCFPQRILDLRRSALGSMMLPQDTLTAELIFSDLCFLRAFLLAALKTKRFMTAGHFRRKFRFKLVPNE